MKTITIDQVSTARMVAGNENKFSTIVHDGKVKQWVGIGWIDLRPATDQDRERFPVAVPEVPDIPSPVARQLFLACKTLVEAYRQGLRNGGSVDWNDVDRAHELAGPACRAVNKLDKQAKLNRERS